MKRYNGWANYPTWNLMLWESENIYDLAKQHRHMSVYDFSKFLKDFYSEAVYDKIDNDASFISDILGWAFEYIDFYEIAEIVMQEVRED